MSTESPPTIDGIDKRVFHDLYCRGPGFLAVTWLLAHPRLLPSVSSTGDTGRLRKGNKLLTGGEEGVGKEPNHTTVRKPGLL
jgi:hypothetical protein